MTNKCYKGAGISLKEMFDRFPKTFLVLENMEDGVSITEIVKNYDYSYKHTQFLLKLLERHKFIRSTKKGRERNFYVTVKGKRKKVILKELFSNK